MQALGEIRREKLCPHPEEHDQSAQADWSCVSKDGCTVPTRCDPSRRPRH